MSWLVVEDQVFGVEDERQDRRPGETLTISDPSRVTINFFMIQSYDWRSWWSDGRFLSGSSSFFPSTPNSGSKTKESRVCGRRPSWWLIEDQRRKKTPDTYHNIPSSAVKPSAWFLEVGSLWHILVTESLPTPGRSSNDHARLTDRRSKENVNRRLKLSKESFIG